MWTHARAQPRSHDSGGDDANASGADARVGDEPHLRPANAVRVCGCRGSGCAPRTRWSCLNGRVCPRSGGARSPTRSTRSTCSTPASPESTTSCVRSRASSCWTRSRARRLARAGAFVRDRRRRALRLPRKLISYAGLAPKSANPVTARAPARYPRPARGPCAGPPSKPPNTPATHEPVAPALHRARRARRQGPRQGRRRAQGPDRRLAPPVPPTAIQARRSAPARACLAKLPLLARRLTAPHGIEKPRRLQRTPCADPSAEREMRPPQPRGARRLADPRGGASTPKPETAR